MLCEHVQHRNFGQDDLKYVLALHPCAAWYGCSATADAAAAGMNWVQRHAIFVPPEPLEGHFISSCSQSCLPRPAGQCPPRPLGSQDGHPARPAIVAAEQWCPLSTASSVSNSVLCNIASRFSRQHCSEQALVLSAQEKFRFSHISSEWSLSSPHLRE